MRDAEWDAQKARVEALIARWVKPLGLGWWTLRFDYTQQIVPTGEDGAGEVMNCKVLWQYNRATITIRVPEIVNLSDDDLEWMFVHELCHIFVRETREQTDDWMKHEEHVCSVLASAFLWLRDHLKKKEEV